MLGGISLAMAADIAETTQIERPPRGSGKRSPSRSHACSTPIKSSSASAADWPSGAQTIGETTAPTDLVISDVLRTNELQQRFLNEHLV